MEYCRNFLLAGHLLRPTHQSCSELCNRSLLAMTINMKSIEDGLGDAELDFKIMMEKFTGSPCLKASGECRNSPVAKYLSPEVTDMTAVNKKTSGETMSLAGKSTTGTGFLYRTKGIASAFAFRSRGCTLQFDLPFCLNCLSSSKPSK